MSDFTLPLLEWVNIPANGDQPAFQITRYPITNEQFEAFIDDAGYKVERWWEGLALGGGKPRASDWRENDCPKLEVTWYEAVGFCRWLSGRLGAEVRLPTEDEWVWAAVGDSGWAYPYGLAFDSQKCNTKESEIGRTTSVTAYAHVQTHFGTVDMSGNVWEWCLNEGDNPANLQLEGSENRVLRGGSWNNAADQASVTGRSSRTPRTRTFNIGFRVVMR